MREVFGTFMDSSCLVQFVRKHVLVLEEKMRQNHQDSCGQGFHLDSKKSKVCGKDWRDVNLGSEEYCLLLTLPGCICFSYYTTLPKVWALHGKFSLHRKALKM